MTEERKAALHNRYYGLGIIRFVGLFLAVCTFISVFYNPDDALLMMVGASVHILAARILQEIYRLQDLIGGANDHD